MDRDTLTHHMLRAGRQWAVCVAMGDYDEAARLRDEIDGYSFALDRLDNPWTPDENRRMSSRLRERRADPYDCLKGSPDTSRLGTHG